VTPEADLGKDQSIAAAVYANQEMARQQLEATRQLQEQHKQKAIDHSAALALAEEQRRQRDEERTER
jgi:hypothetical protein